LKFNEVVYNAN